ncbi:MAG: hypothetical protein EBR91_11730, partial [Flavobacteriia bacterium]|nr:hypothetical protein [Flavobacteriia bacterium]
KNITLVLFDRSPKIGLLVIIFFTFCVNLFQDKTGSLLIISSHLPLIPPQGGKKFAPPMRKDKGG